MGDKDSVGFAEALNDRTGRVHGQSGQRELAFTPGFLSNDVNLCMKNWPRKADKPLDFSPRSPAPTR